MCDDDVVAKVAFERERFYREPRGEGVQRGEEHVRRSRSPTGGGGAARGRYRRWRVRRHLRRVYSGVDGRFRV